MHAFLGDSVLERDNMLDPNQVQTAAVQQQQRQQKRTQPAGNVGSLIPNFGPVDVASVRIVRDEFRRVSIPPHRMTPLRQDWERIMKPIVDHMKLQVRVNPKNRCVEMKVGFGVGYCFFKTDRW